MFSSSSSDPHDSLGSDNSYLSTTGLYEVSQAVFDELVEAGLLERRHGLGIFVLDTQLDYQIGKGTRFTITLPTP